MRLSSRADPTRTFLGRLSLALWIITFALTSAAPLAAAWQTAPSSLPIPPPPPAEPPQGFTSAETERARIYVEPGTEIDATAFARAWGLLIDDGLDQLESFLPSLHDKIDVYVYVSEDSYTTATATTRWAEPEATDVLANPGRGDSAVNAIALARRTPLEAEK